MAIKLKPEPVWAKYIMEDNLPTDDIRFIAEVMGLDITKKLMFNLPGFKLSIHAYCNQPYKKQYIIDNYLTESVAKLALDCETTTRYVYKVIKEHVEGKKGKKS